MNTILPFKRDALVAIRDGKPRNTDVRVLRREIRRQPDVILKIERFLKSTDLAGRRMPAAISSRCTSEAAAQAGDYASDQPLSLMTRTL